MSFDDKPSMEGFLEKHSTGVSRLLGKTKFWCTLRGSCLVYCKENKRSSMVETLLLGDAQMVRKTSNDRQGVQFEIVMKKNKTHVFSAASSDECGNWVKYLQQAMIRNEPGARMSGIDFRRQIASDSGYEEIKMDSGSNPSFANQRTDIAVPQSGIYADVADAIKVKSEGFPIPTFVNSSVGVYAEVADVIKPKETSDSQAPDEVTKRENVQSEVVYRENSLYVGNKEKEKIQKQIQTQQDLDDMGGGYSTLDSLHDVEATIMASQPEPEQDSQVDQVIKSGSDIPEYAKVNKQPKSKQPALDEDDVYVNIGEDTREGAAIERLDNELKRLPVSSVPPAWESMTADDRKPLEDLKEFLDNNRHLRRSSYVRQTSEGDPLSKIKEIILSLS